MVSEYFDAPRSACAYSVVIPCYRSGSWLPDLVSRIASALAPRAKPFEIILVNDASPDATWDEIVKLAAEQPTIRGIDLQFNVGQYRATLCGLAQARGQYIVTMDDDLQHAPEEIPKLISAIESQSDVDCFMGRFATKRHSLVRNLGSRFMRWLNVRLYGAPKDVVPSSFRIMRRTLAQALCEHGTVKPILSPLIFGTTARVRNVAIEHEPRRHGRSGYGLLQLVRIVLDNVFSALTWPLRMVSILGLASASASLLLGLYYLVKFFTFRTRVQGFTTQVLLIIFFGGLTLFAIGLVGEYLGRVIEEVRRPPRYFVRARTGQRDDRDDNEGLVR